MIHSKSHHDVLHHLFHLKIDKEMLELGIFQLSVNLGKILVGLSLIFHMIINLDWEIWQVLTYFFFYQVGFSLSGPFAGILIKKLGVKHTISSRAFASIPYYLALTYFLSIDFESSILYLFPFMLVRSIFFNASTVASDAFLSHHLTKKTRGKMMAWIQIAIASAAVFGPIAGGFVTAFWGFQYVAYAGMTISFIGGITLYLTPDEKLKLPYSPKQVLLDTKNKVPISLYLSEFGRVFFDLIFWLIWPIFLVISIGDIKSMGLLTGASSAIALITAFFIGNVIDKSKKPLGKMINHGAVRSTIINFIRVIWLDPFFLTTIDALSKINDQTIKTPYELEISQWISGKNSLERSHQRSIIYQNYYTIFIAIFIGIFYFVPDPKNMFIYFISFAAGSLSLLLLSQIAKTVR